MVNYLAPFSLTLKLLDLIKKSDKGRIINVSSMIHASDIDFNNLNGEKYYSGEDAYSLSKLLNILFTYELSDRLKLYGVTVNALHPGVINTKLLKSGWGVIGSSSGEGAKRIYFLAASTETGNITGKYFFNDKVTRPAEISYDLQVRKKLWDISLEFVNRASK